MDSDAAAGRDERRVGRSGRLRGATSKPSDVSEIGEMDVGPGRQWWCMWDLGGEEEKEDWRDELEEEEGVMEISGAMLLRCFWTASCWECSRRYFWRAKEDSGHCCCTGLPPVDMAC
jgi:hypothetical protein